MNQRNIRLLRVDYLDLLPIMVLTIKAYHTSAFPVSFTPNQPLEPIHILFYATLAIKTKPALNHNMYSSY